MSVQKEVDFYFCASSDKAEPPNNEAPYLRSRTGVKESKNTLHVTFPDDKIVT
jgi:hypothetical protein